MKIHDIISMKAINVPVNGTFVISKCELHPFLKKEGYFLSCLLSDKTGTIKGIVWEKAEELKKWLSDKTVVTIKGKFTRYNDISQIIIEDIHEETNFNSEDFIQAISKEQRNDLIFKMAKFIKDEELITPPCIDMWKEILKIEDFKTCPGGVGKVHHNYIGGLLEHTYNIIDLLSHLKNDALDSSIMLTGALVHVAIPSLKIVRRFLIYFLLKN